MTDETFFGVPITGEKNRGSEPRVPQLPDTELAPLLQAVLNDPLVESFGWDQYTPYFNDGEPCVFRAGAPWFRTVHDGSDVDQDTLEIRGYSPHPTLGSIPDGWFLKNYPGDYPEGARAGEYIGDHEGTFRACMALNKAIQSGAFDDALLDHFGDHASITVSKDGIEIEFYEHD